jgi:hypothetical protein
MDTVLTATFWFSSILIIPIWGLMWFLPRHEYTNKFVGDLRYTVIPLAVSYSILLAPNLFDVIFALGREMPTPEIVINLFSTDEMIILAWLHFLVMDTFAGRHIWLRMVQKNKPIQISMPVLLLCMMIAPVGLALGIFLTTDGQEFKSDVKNNI